MTRSQHSRANHEARDSMLWFLREGTVDAKALTDMQAAMAALEPNRQAFGTKRYDELRQLLDTLETLPIGQPAPMPPPMPAPMSYDKIIPVILIAIAACVAAGFVTYHPIARAFAVLALLIAGYIWIARRYPLVAIMILGFASGLLGGGRRGRW